MQGSAAPLRAPLPCTRARRAWAQQARGSRAACTSGAQASRGPWPSVQHPAHSRLSTPAPRPAPRRYRKPVPPRYQAVLDSLAAKQREIEAFHETHKKSEVRGGACTGCVGLALPPGRGARSPSLFPKSAQRCRLLCAAWPAPWVGIVTGAHRGCSRGARSPGAPAPPAALLPSPPAVRRRRWPAATRHWRRWCRRPPRARWPAPQRRSSASTCGRRVSPGGRPPCVAGTCSCWSSPGVDGRSAGQFCDSAPPACLPPLRSCAGEQRHAGGAGGSCASRCSGCACDGRGVRRPAAGRSFLAARTRHSNSVRAHALCPWRPLPASRSLCPPC